jgi:hypothetical protein
MIFLAQAVLSQLLALTRCSVLMPTFARVDASQPDNWRPVFELSKELLVTSTVISDIRKYAQGGFLGTPHSNTKPRERPSIPSFWHGLKQRERLSYPGFLQQMKPVYIIMKRRLIGNPWNGTIPNFTGRKIQKFSVSGQVTITVFWDCEGVNLVDVTPGGKTINSEAYFRTLK